MRGDTFIVQLYKLVLFLLVLVLITIANANLENLGHQFFQWSDLTPGKKEPHFNFSYKLGNGS